MKLTQERLKELLGYDPETGVFIWKVANTNRIRVGGVAGYLHHSGYLNISINGKTYQSHRLAFLYMEGYLPENDVDHIDRNRSNNEWKNLREVSRSCNLRNCKIRETNKSGITGVCFNKRDKKWMATIRIPKQNINLGYFDNIIEAVKARWQAEVEHSFPNCNTTSSAYNYLREHGAI